MAISWGSTNGHLRVGIDVSQSPSSVSKGTSSVTLTVKYYVQSVKWGFQDNQTLTLSGAISGSVNYYMSSPSNGTVTKHVATRTVSVSTSYNGSVSRTFTAKVAGAYNGASPSKSRTWTVSKRPPQNPAAPTNASVSRASDSQQNLSWTNNPNNPSAPYDATHVDRWDVASGSWKRVMNGGPSRSSWSDSTTSTNNRYRYRVRASNSSGTSSWAYTDYIATTPSAPANSNAARSGSDIVVTWDNTARYQTGVRIVDRPDGGEWDYDNQVDLSGTPTSYTFTSPDPAVSHEYAILAKADARTSGWEYTNSVQLLTNPAAPSQLSPSGVARDGSADLVLTWKHNPQDASPQTAFEVEHRAQGAGTWTSTGKITSTASTWTLPADTYANGQTIEWRVRTWGDYVDPSIFSPSGLVTLSTAPIATVTAPEAGVAWGTPLMTVRWDYYDAEDDPQAVWRVNLYDASGTRVETIQGTGTTGARLLKTTLADGSSYEAGVEVQDSTGLWSTEDRSSFSVEYAKPPAPVVTTQWAPEAGVVAISVDNPPPDDGQVEATRNEVWHSANGAEWSLVSIIPVGGAVTDYLPALSGVNYYRVVAFSDLPSASEATTEVTTNERARVWLNGGPGFGLAVPCQYDPAVSFDVSRDKVLHKFAGRSKPVAFAGEHVSRAGTVSATLLDYTPEDVEALALADGPACYRDPEGRRIFCDLSDMSVGRQPGGPWTLSVSITEIDYQQQDN